MESNELKLISDLKFNQKAGKEYQQSKFVTCIDCQQKLSIDRIQRHRDFYCPRTTSKCPVCSAFIQNDTADAHVEQCLASQATPENEKTNQDAEISWEYGSEYESEEAPEEETKVESNLQENKDKIVPDQDLTDSGEDEEIDSLIKP